MHARLNFIVPGTGLLGSPSLLELDFLVTSGSQAGSVRNREVSISIDFNILYSKIKKWFVGPRGFLQKFSYHYARGAKFTYVINLLFGSSEIILILMMYVCNNLLGGCVEITYELSTLKAIFPKNEII